MSHTHVDPLSVLADWIVNAKNDLTMLASEVKALVSVVAHRWRADPSFRAYVTRTVLQAVATAAMKGPRRVVLMAVSAIASLLAVGVEILDGGTVRAF